MFQPVLPLGGFAGWSFLNRTLDTQKDAFAQSSEVVRETNYFLENIGKVKTADDLVSDRTLLKVALGAFGLDDDIGNTYFIRKVLEEGTLSGDSLANRLSDKRYAELSRTFGFGDYSVPGTALSDFGTRIVSAYQDRQFEIAVGEQNENYRLAMGIPRDLGKIAGKDQQDDTLWFTVMGTPPLRKVFETVYGLPQSFGALDLDKQLQILKNKTQAVFGDSSIKQFTTPEAQKKLARLFMLRADIQASGAGAGSGEIALTILQGVTGPLRF